MIESSRHRRSQIRTLVRSNRARSRAIKALRANSEQPLKLHLLARGLDLATAQRFAGAMSRTIRVAASQRTTAIKLHGRRVRIVPVWTYRAAQVDKALATYRPKDRGAAARFERIAA